MLYLVYGEDDYSVQRHVRAIVEQHGDTGQFGVQRLDGASAKWGDIIAACAVMPFFGQRQVVVVDGLIAASARRRSTSGDDKGKPGASPEALRNLAAGLPETTVLVLQEGVLQTISPHLKALAALGTGVETRQCSILEGPARASWVASEAAGRGGAIDRVAAELLAVRIPGSLRPLSNALDTLIAYAGEGRPIARADVEALVAPDQDDNVFHLSDAIAARDAGRALTLTHTLLARGMAEEQALAMLAGRVRDWTLVAAFKAAKVPEGEAMRRLGWNPSKYRMVSRGEAQFKRGELPTAYQALVVVDEALKSRPGDERPLIVDMLVFTLATRGDAGALRQAFPAVL